MDPSGRSSKSDRGTSARSSSTRRETTTSRQASQRRGSQQPQQHAGRSTRPEAFYASVEPLSVRRGLHNSLVVRVPDPDTNSAPNSPLARPRGVANSSGQQVQHSSSLPTQRHQQQYRDSIIGTSARRGGKKSASNVNEDLIQSSSNKYYNYAGVSRREIIGRRCVGSQQQLQHDDNAIERFAQTLRHRWKQRATTDESARGNERVNNNTAMPEPCLEERPRTLPSIVRKSRGGYVESYNSAELLPEGRRISRQDILNRRTSSFGGNNTSYGLIRRKSSGALEVAGLSQSQSSNVYRNDDRQRCDEIVRKNSSFVKNTSAAQQRSVQREQQQQQQQQQNTARRRRDGSMERSRAGGSRSVADFLTVSSRLRDITRGLVPRPSTLPKIVHTSRASRAESDWTGIGRSYRDLASREAPIYGRIRRRKLSLPSRDSQIRKSTSSLTRFARGKSNSSTDFDADFALGDNQRIRNSREAYADFSYQRRSEASSSQTDMRIECKKNSNYGRVLRTNTSSSKSSSQTTGGHRESKPNEARCSSFNDRKSAQQLVAPTGRELRHVSRRRIIDNVEDTSESPIASPSARRLQTSSMREIDYATIDFGLRKSFGMTKRRESSSASRRTQNTANESDTKSMQRTGVRKNSDRIDDVETSMWNRQKDKSREDRGKRGETRSGSQEISSRSTRCNHASTTLPLYAKSVRKSSSCTSSGIPLKIATKTSEKTNSKSTTKSAKDRTNYVKKSVAAHVKSFSEANSPRSESPGTSSGIFGFCTGRRKVREEGKKDLKERATRVGAVVNPS